MVRPGARLSLFGDIGLRLTGYLDDYTPQEEDLPADERDWTSELVFTTELEAGASYDLSPRTVIEGGLRFVPITREVNLDATFDHSDGQTGPRGGLWPTTYPSRPSASAGDRGASPTLRSRLRQCTTEMANSTRPWSVTAKPSG